MNAEANALLRAILGMAARQAIPVDELIKIVAPKGAGADQINAFNLCDGTRSQSDVAKAAGLDAGNFSRTLSRWIDAGIVLRLGENREATLLHVYPIPKDRIGKETGR